MTRESKIALVVGLGFIICFGVILSEARTDKMAQAPAPVLLPVDAGAVERVMRLEPMTVVAPPVLRLPEPQPILAEAACESTPKPNDSAPSPSVVESAAVRVYTVEAGDSLSRIAAKVYGSGEQRRWQMIFDANRDTLRAPSRVRPGQKLRIPALAGDAGGQPVTAAAPSRDVREMNVEEIRQYLAELERRQGARPTAARTVARSVSRGRTYTVRSGDTLTAIARRTMGDDSRRAVAALQQINRSVVPDANRLRVGALLRIPE